jgi:3-hydroxy-9,10-secoandrosta-1,3,5(10)-triene-9,17-dione monooxygenase reductase component
MSSDTGSPGSPDPGPSPEIPEGIRPDARETWPSKELIDSFLGTGFDFELRLGEHTPIPTDDPEAAERARQFRDVLGLFCTGVTVVTSVSDGNPVGMTCQSFSSVSLDPPLVLFVPARSSRAWPVIQRTGRFCVNVLGADQEPVSAQMATKGADKFTGIEWHPAEATGSPVIEGSLAHLDCTIHTVHESGDHYVVIGRVEHLETTGRDDVSPLLYFRGRYRTTDS